MAAAATTPATATTATAPVVHFYSIGGCVTVALEGARSSVAASLTPSVSYELRTGHWPSLIGTSPINQPLNLLSYLISFDFFEKRNIYLYFIIQSISFIPFS